jgi:hypothetical protein
MRHHWGSHVELPAVNHGWPEIFRSEKTSNTEWIMIETRKWKKTTVASVLLGICAVPIADAVADDLAFGPTDSVLGMSLGDWGAAWWQWILSIPADSNPLLDADGSFCGEGQGSGPVFFLAGTWTDLVEGGRTCTVPAGKAIFFPMVNSECSSVEVKSPWYCDDEAECRECAGFHADTFDPGSLVVIVDGVELEGLAQYRAQSATYTFTMPSPNNNILGVPFTKGISVSDGYWMMLKPLSLGEHTIHFEGGPSDGSWLQDVTYTITVE